MTNKRWFLIAVAILFILIIITLLIQVSIIFYPLMALVSTIFLPLLIGGLFYYIALSFQALLERNGLSRLAGIMIIILIFLLAIGVIGYFTVPAIIDESRRLVERWPEFEQEFIGLGTYLTAQREALPEILVTVIDNLMMFISDSFTSAISDIVSIVTNTVTALFMVFIFPFFFFFMLKDHEKFIPSVTSPFSGNLKSFMINLLVDIDEVLKAFVENRVMASIIRALILYIGFAFINLDYAILLVLLALFLNVIPFLGAWITFITVSVFTLVQSPVMMVPVIVIFIASHYIESRWITPRMVTSKLHIHPLTVMTLVITSVKFAGLWGLILVLPLYAVLRVIIISLYRHRHDIKSALMNDTVKT